MADWTKPTILSQYDLFVDEVKARDIDVANMFLATPTAPLVGFIRYNRTTDIFEEWDGGAWQPIIIGVTGGGTGAGSTGGIISSLGLGTMSVQNHNAVNIIGGTIGTSVNIDATRITSNLVPAARLGDGTPSSAKYLAGDQTWVDFPAGETPLVGMIVAWMLATPPAKWLTLNGQAVSRVTYNALFAIWGVSFGAGDGSTTFNVPDFRGRFPLGQAAAGTGSGALGTTFGAMDHTHTGPSHTHTIPNHTHGAGSYTTGSHNHGGSTGTVNVSGTTSSHGGHTHGFDGSVSGTTTNESTSTFNVDAGSSGFMARGNHTHDFTKSFSGTTDSGGSHSHTFSGSGTGSISSSTLPVSGTSASDGEGNTGAGGTGATGVSNPPGIIVNWIVRAQ